MMKKSNKTIYVMIGAVVLVIVVATTVLVMTNKNKDGSGSDNSGTSGSSSSSGGGSSSSYKVSSAELKNPDVKISYGDYDAMETLSSDIQNGRMTGKVVEIDGAVSHPGQSYSIVQVSADGKQKIGTAFNIEDSSEYPKDGVRIVITAKVLEKSALNYQLFTLKEFVREK